VLALFVQPTHGDTLASLTLDNMSSDRGVRDFAFSHVPYGNRLEHLTQEKLNALEFVSAREKLPNFGYNRGQIVARFEINNLSSQTDWILRLGNPHLKNLRLYRQHHEKLEEIVRTGIDEPFVSRPIGFCDFWIPFKLDFQERQVFYLLTESSQWLGLVPHLSTSAVARDIKIENGHSSFSALVASSLFCSTTFLSFL